VSQNYPELAGVQTKIHQLNEELNLKLREGRLLGIGDVLAKMTSVVREADWTVSRLMGHRAIAEMKEKK
jgi:hypothetical protein